jgi:hypothetical protein
MSAAYKTTFLQASHYYSSPTSAKQQYSSATTHKGAAVQSARKQERPQLSAKVKDQDLYKKPSLASSESKRVLKKVAA